MDGRDKVKKKSTDNYIEEVLDNIRHDRAITKGLLTDLLIYIKKSKENHREVGIVAAKYVETLQRSNEQLVKLTTMLNKGPKTSDSTARRRPLPRSRIRLGR